MDEIISVDERVSRVPAKSGAQHGTGKPASPTHPLPLHSQPGNPATAANTVVGPLTRPLHIAAGASWSHGSDQARTVEDDVVRNQSDITSEITWAYNGGIRDCSTLRGIEVCRSLMSNLLADARLLPYLHPGAPRQCGSLRNDRSERWVVREPGLTEPRFAVGEESRCRLSRPGDHPNVTFEKFLHHPVHPRHRIASRGKTTGGRRSAPRTTA